MTHFIYSINNNYSAGETDAINKYAKSHNLSGNFIFHETADIRNSWPNRDIGKIIYSASPMDTVAVFNITDLATSAHEAFDIIKSAIEKKMAVYFIKHDMKLSPDSHWNKLENVLHFASIAALEFNSKRNKPGRPTGTRAKELMLDKHKDQIFGLLSKKVSKSSIAKIVGCSRPTLYDYLKLNGIKAKHHHED